MKATYEFKTEENISQMLLKKQMIISIERNSVASRFIIQSITAICDHTKFSTYSMDERRQLFNINNSINTDKESKLNLMCNKMKRQNKKYKIFNKNATS